MRAIRARYNPYLQTKHRLEQVLSLYSLRSTTTIYNHQFRLAQTTWSQHRQN